MNRPLRLLALALLAAAALTACKKETVCPTGEAACGAQCVPLDSDPLNCGACGNACGPLGTCSAGTCDCAAGTTACGNTCVDTRTDPAHCGACGAACTAATPFCATDGATACAAACPGGLQACGHACVDHQTDRLHCGACGVVCQPGASCEAGACSSVQVACFASDDVRAVSPALDSDGSPRAGGDGPISLAALGADVWAVASLSGSLIRQPLDQAVAPVEYALHGNDFEFVAVHQGRLYVSNSTAGSVVVADPLTGAPLDEITFPGQVNPYPHGIAFVGGRAYVALYGKDEASGGQAVAVLDLAAGPCSAAGTRCATVARTVDLRALADAPGLPFPSRPVAVGTRVYVTVSNLMKDTDPASFTFGYYVLPAGHGKLAVLDAAADDALTSVDLGAGCGNPGSMAPLGTTLWVSCAAFGAAGLLPVDVSGAPAPGSVVATTLGAPGNVAFCGGMGFVTDQWSGDVLRFDPSGVTAPATRTICPNGPQGWAWAADVLCATAP